MNHSSSGMCRAVPVLVLLALTATGCAGRSREGRSAGDGETGAGASPLDVARAFYGALHGGDAEGAAKLAGSPNARPATDSW